MHPSIHCWLASVAETDSSLPCRVLCRLRTRLLCRLGRGQVRIAQPTGESMMHGRVLLTLSVTLGMLGATNSASAQQASAAADPWCTSKPAPAFCHAVRGVRATGWPAQTRSEVMAANGMVVTSQPLAAQAGLQ